MRVVDHAEPGRAASPEQRAALTDVVRRALGAEARITNVSDSTPCGVDGVNEQARADVEPDAWVAISWPDRDDVTIDVRGHTDAGTHLPTGYAIAGAAGPVDGGAAARRVADRYVATHYPKGAGRRHAVVGAPEDGSVDAWTVTYPYRDADLPAVKSLQVTLNRAGRLRGVRLTGTAPGGDAASGKADAGAKDTGGACP